MDKQAHDEQQELTEFRRTARETEAVKALEVTEFIDNGDGDDGRDRDSGERQHAPVPLIEDAAARREYWQTQGLIELQQSAFAAALSDGDSEHQRSAYFQLAVDHGRSLYLLRSALNAGRQALARAAMRNLASLQRAMTQMHKQAPQHDTDIDAPSLCALVGEPFHARLQAAGFARLSDVVARQSAFREALVDITGIDQTSAALLVDLVGTLLEHQNRQTSAWRCADLVGSPYPRPYQYEAYALLRGYGYQGQLVEAPTGSGKTLIGMMCIQDWLRNLRPGQSILILVPTSDYQQQWAGELCYQPVGLRLPPERVFSGAPGQLENFQRRSGSHPAIILMTYTALAQAGPAVGKGGFDIDAIKSFLQGANVQYVVLDEVHKVAESPRSVSADLIRLMLDWLHDCSLQGLIGFTGSAEALRSRFTRLGLELAYSIPIDELITAGLVAPFAELGAPFSYSARERHIRSLLDQYKAHMSSFLNLIGGERLRGWFAAIPMRQRLSLGHDLLNMARGNKHWQAALRKRLSASERGGKLKLTELKLVNMIQIARQWSDADMAREAGIGAGELRQLLAELTMIRLQLVDHIYLPETLRQLRQPGFGEHFDAAGLLQAHTAASNQALRNEVVKEGLATNIVGLYEALSEWYRRVGEGRIQTIKAIIEAERASREISGTIIVDNARRIHWQQGPAIPGHEGLGGLYAELLGDPRFTPYAVLPSEQYLPYDEHFPLPPRIADFIEEQLMLGEVASAMFALCTQGLDWPEGVREDLRIRWDGLITWYLPRLQDVHSARPGQFSRRILRPMRRRIRSLELASFGTSAERMLSRMDLRNLHFADLVQTFFDYAIITRHFRQAKVAELEQVSGVRQKFFVIPMPSGSHKLLMYDLSARLVDAESLPINLIVVSNWARTGCNASSPNLLIDATASRNVNAWQQLRGRAIRARRSWNNDCYRLIMALIGSQQVQGLLEQPGEIPDDVAELLRQQASQQASQQPSDTRLDQGLLSLLDQVTPAGLRSHIGHHGLRGLSNRQRTDIAIELVRHFNKVTHIYELVKAYGSSNQLSLNRSEGVWQRHPNIAAKHDFEVSVNPLNGENSIGVSHSPLVYAKDPRSDSPAELQEQLSAAIRDQDDVIVSGWFGAALPLSGRNEPTEDRE